MGVSRYGSSTDLLLRLTLDKWGLKPEQDVHILQMGGVPPILHGMQSKKIAGGPLSLPTLARAKQEGFRELADLADLIPEYQVDGSSLAAPSSNNSRRSRAASSKPLRKASHTFRNDTTFVRKVMKERLKVDDPLIADETQKAYPRYMPDIPYPSRGGVAVIKEFMEKTEPGLQKLSVDDQLDMTIIRELEQSGFFSGLQGA